jgi:hypothetical protein
MKVFIERVKTDDIVSDKVPGSGVVRMQAEEGGYKVSIGIESVFITESDMWRARETGKKIQLTRYGD